MHSADLNNGRSEADFTRYTIDYYVKVSEKPLAAHPPAHFFSCALTGRKARVAQVWCSGLVDAAGYVGAPTSSLWACGRGPTCVPEFSVFVRRV